MSWSGVVSFWEISRRVLELGASLEALLEFGVGSFLERERQIYIYVYTYIYIQRERKDTHRDGHIFLVFPPEIRIGQSRLFCISTGRCWRRYRWYKIELFPCKKQKQSGEGGFTDIGLYMPDLGSSKWKDMQLKWKDMNTTSKNMNATWRK